VPPAAGVVVLAETMYFDAGIAAVVTVVVPVRLPVVAVIVCVVFAVVLVVNVTLARPLAFVVLDDDPNEPPFVLLHVTV